MLFPLMVFSLFYDTTTPPPIICFLAEYIPLLQGVLTYNILCNTFLKIKHFGANVVRAHERFPCGGRRSGH